MLNTIYEELDLVEKIKSLKDKKIKIKRVVKNKDGSLMAESQIIN